MLLDQHQIQQHLQEANFQEKIECHVLDSIDSTNRYLKDVGSMQNISLCCAETQTHGRGRFQRTWFSPRAENIYCSLRWHFPNPNQGLSALSLVISLAIAQTLQDHYFIHFEDGFDLASQLLISKDDGLSIKWPNDLIWQDKKLCGILLETIPHPTIGLYVIIGIGLNVNSDSKSHPSKDAPQKPWCSIYDITQQIVDRNWLIAQLMVVIAEFISRFNKDGFESFMPLWHRYDYLKGKTVRISSNNAIMQGIVQGINTQGELLIKDQKNQNLSINSGEASVISHHR